MFIRKTLLGMLVIAALLGVPAFAQESQDGVLVTQVDPDSPAAIAGIQRGDVIRSINGTDVNSARELTEALSAAEGPVRITFTHGDARRTVSVDLVRVWGQPHLGVAVSPGPLMRGGPGMHLQPFRLSMTPGAMVLEVLGESPAEAAGLVRGDVITHVNQEQLTDGGLAEVIGDLSPGAQVTLTFQRDGQAQTATARLGTNDDGGAFLGLRYTAFPDIQGRARDLQERLRNFGDDRRGGPAQPRRGQQGVSPAGSSDAPL